MTKDLAGGDKAVLFFNEGKTAVKQSVSMAALGLSSGHLVRDLWSHADSSVADALTARVDASLASPLVSPARRSSDDQPCPTV